MDTASAACIAPPAWINSNIQLIGKFPASVSQTQVPLRSHLADETTVPKYNVLVNSVLYETRDLLLSVECILPGVADRQRILPSFNEIKALLDTFNIPRLLQS